MWTAPSLLFVTWCPRGGLSHKEWNGNSTMIIITYHHNRLEEPKSQSIQSQFTAVTSSFGKKISHWPTGRGHHTTAWVDVFMIARYCKVSLSLCCNRFALASTVPHNWSQRNNTCFDHLLFKYHSNTGLLVASTVPAQGVPKVPTYPAAEFHNVSGQWIWSMSSLQLSSANHRNISKCLETRQLWQPLR